MKEIPADRKGTCIKSTSKDTTQRWNVCWIPMFLHTKSAIGCRSTAIDDGFSAVLGTIDHALSAAWKKSPPIAKEHVQNGDRKIQLSADMSANLLSFYTQIADVSEKWYIYELTPFEYVKFYLQCYCFTGLQPTAAKRTRPEIHVRVFFCWLFGKKIIM